MGAFHFGGKNKIHIFNNYVINSRLYSGAVQLWLCFLCRPPHRHIYRKNAARKTSWDTLVSDSAPQNDRIVNNKGVTPFLKCTLIWVSIDIFDGGDDDYHY